MFKGYMTDCQKSILVNTLTDTREFKKWKMVHTMVCPSQSLLVVYEKFTGA